MPDVGNPVYTTMVSSIQEVARGGGFRLLLALDGRRRRGRARDGARSQAPLRGRADPRLALPDRGARRRAEARGRTRGRDRPSEQGDAGGHRTRLLAQGSCRSRPTSALGREATDRLCQRADPHRPRLRRAGSGYLDGLRSCGLPRDESLIEVATDFMVEPGRRAAERLLARARPDAILGANDLLAVGVLAALRDARPRRSGGRRAGRHGQQRPLRAHLAGADDRRPRLGRARADRGRAAARADRGARAASPRSSASSRGSSCGHRRGPRHERRPELGPSRAAAAGRGRGSPAERRCCC